MKSIFIKEKQDLTYLEWAKSRKSSGTVGTFLKASDITKDGKKVYYKLSNYDTLNGIIGYECIYELISSRILDVLEFSHVNYELIYATICIDELEPHTRLLIYELGSFLFLKFLSKVFVKLHMSNVFSQLIYRVYKYLFFLCICHEL